MAQGNLRHARRRRRSGDVLAHAEPHQTVTVTTNGGERIHGRVADVDRSSRPTVTIQRDDGTTVAVALAQVVAIELG